MLEALLLAVLCQPTINADLRPRPEPTPFMPIIERPLVELDEATVEAVMPIRGTTPPVVLKVYSPSWCPTCPAWKSRLGNGNEGVTLRWVNENPPVGYPGPVPAFFTADGRYWDWGAGFANTPTLANLSEFAGVPVRSMKPVTVGTLNAKGYIDGFVDTLKAFGGNRMELRAAHGGKGWIDFGQAGVFLPTGLVATVEHTGSSSRLTFSGTKPRVRLLAIDQPIDGVVYDGTTLKVDFSGWMLPDAEFRVR